jgi:hypothetical protein
MVKNPKLSKPVVTMLKGPDPLWREQFLGGSPERERALFAEFERDIKRLQARVQQKQRPGRPLRGFHAKMLLGVHATLIMEDELPHELCTMSDEREARGFLKPGERYPVTVRFSSSSHEVKADKKRNGRGIALRIHEQEDEQADDKHDDRPEARAFYDLLFSDSPASHARDAAQFMTFVKVLSAPIWKKPVPLLRELGVAESARLLVGVVRQTFGPKRSLALTRFWGKTPMAINACAVKYQLLPMAADELPLAPNGSDFMRDDLIRRMAQGDVVYQLRIQRFVDEQRTPLEDHSIEWQERDAPPETIAHLLIERGAFEAQPPELESAIEQLAYNPWNTSPALRPLGSFNRARKFVYAASADQRQRPPAQDRIEALLQRIEPPLLELLSSGFTYVNKLKPWHELPRVLGMLNLVAIRHRMRHHNLHDTEDMVEPLMPAGCPMAQRDQTGRDNDLQFPEMGSAGRRFGRNVPREAGLPAEGPELLSPSPREISRKLLARERFVPATSLNLLAAGWIQYQTHDWFAHDERRGPSQIKLELAPDDAWKGGNPMVVPCTPLAARTTFEREHRQPPTHQNLASHWWDGSQLYGSDAKTALSLRDAGKATLELTSDELLPLGQGDGALPRTGSNQNWWFGLELMHTLFAREHNAICAMLRRSYPSWSEDILYEKARLINVALMAKIHTIEWTPAILAHPALELSMNAHWWGIFGEQAQRRFGKWSRSELIGGIPGSRREHFEVPFSLTEEFVSVYRLHPLLPDHITLRAPGSTHEETVAFQDLAFARSRQSITRLGLANLAYSFGVASPGAMCLQNYPRFLIELESPGEAIRDVGSLDILRDRERGIPRYNRFRELLGLPRMRSYGELTGGNDELSDKLKSVYGPDGIDQVDLLVGSLAEPPPAGFGFSDTAFRVFVLMASRRLKSDRFFTDDYNEDTYSAEGLAWIRDHGMRHVLLRSFPELAPALRGVKNVFSPWQRMV